MYWVGAQQTLLLIWARSGPKGNIDGPEPDWPEKKKTNPGPESAWPSDISDVGGGGKIFPPPLLHAER